MSPLNYSHLRYFWAVAHEGNLTRAARNLGVAQSAVSAQIRMLEEELGHELFERKGRQLVLTEAGRIALDHADAIFAMGDELLGTLHERGGPSRQSFRVGALSTLPRNFQVQFLKPLLVRGDVEIVLRSGTLQHLLRHLEAHRIDVLLTNTTPYREAGAEWVAHVIADQPVSLVGHSHRQKDQRELHEILADEPLLLPTAENSTRMGFDALVDRLGIRPKVAVEVDDMAILRQLALEDVGLAVVPPIVVREELDEGRLVEIERFSELREVFYAITVSRRFPHPLLQSLIPSSGR